jgi:hypothetical protein
VPTGWGRGLDSSKAAGRDALDRSAGRGRARVDDGPVGQGRAAVHDRAAGHDPAVAHPADAAAGHDAAAGDHDLAAERHDPVAGHDPAKRHDPAASRHDHAKRHDPAASRHDPAKGRDPAADRHDAVAAGDHRAGEAHDPADAEPALVASPLFVAPWRHAPARASDRGARGLWGRGGSWP